MPEYNFSSKLIKFPLNPFNYVFKGEKMEKICNFLAL